MSTADHAPERLPTPALGDADGWRAFSATIAARVGTRDPLEILSATVPRLEAALRGRSLAELQCPEAPGRWSVAQLVEQRTENPRGGGSIPSLAIENQRLTGFDYTRGYEHIVSPLSFVGRGQCSTGFTPHIVGGLD
jgi:hypothetical protein